MIQLHNINKFYGSLHVLKDIDLTVSDGEIVAVVGPSGAGKTTLLQVAGTLSRPDSGSIIYNGRDITRLGDNAMSRFRNSDIGFIFQFHKLLPEFTAAENVEMPALIKGTPRKEARARAMELLEMLGIASRATHKPAQLSGGEMQRVAIARALINKPSVVFADEPTGSLDSRNRDEIRALISELRSNLGQTFLIVTHDPSVACIADRIVSMADGLITGIEPCEAAPSAEIMEEEKPL